MNVLVATVIGGAVAYQISRCMKQTIDHSHENNDGFDVGYYAIRREMMLTANARSSSTTSSDSTDNKHYFTWYKIIRF